MYRAQASAPGSRGGGRRAALKNKEEEEEEEVGASRMVAAVQTLGKLCNFPFALQLCRGNSSTVASQWAPVSLQRGVSPRPRY